MLEEGMRIRTFSDTDVAAYVGWIRTEGYACYVHKDVIIVGRRLKPGHLNSKLTAALIKKHMKAKKISRKDIQKDLMVSESTVWDWINGIRVPSMYFRQNLLDLLGITQDEWDKCRQ